MSPLHEPVAQLVEHLTFNQMVVGSIPPRLTILQVVSCGFNFRRDLEVLSPYRLAWPRTPPFHGGDGGSNPPGDATLKKPLPRNRERLFLLVFLIRLVLGWFGLIVYRGSTGDTVVALQRGSVCASSGVVLEVVIDSTL